MGSMWSAPEHAGWRAGAGVSDSEAETLGFGPRFPRRVWQGPIWEPWSQS